MIVIEGKDYYNLFSSQIIASISKAFILKLPFLIKILIYLS